MHAPEAAELHQQLPLRTTRCMHVHFAGCHNRIAIAQPELRPLLCAGCWPVLHGL